MASSHVKSRSVSRVRLADVAREAGVSIPTVSKVLIPAESNNARVGEKTAARIREIAEKLNFQPNHVARQLAGKRSRTFGAIIDSMAPEVRYRGLASIEREVAHAGYRLMVGQAHERPQTLLEYASDFFSRGLDGVFCMAHDYPPGFYPKDLVSQIIDAFSQLPNVLFIGKPAFRSGSLSYIYSDIESGIRQAYNHLKSLGCQRIGMVLANQRFLGNLERIDTFKQLLHESGAANPEQQLFTGDETGPKAPNPDFIRSAVQKLVIEDGVDGLISGNDLIAVLLIKELKRCGLAVPGGIPVIGYDNLQVAELYEPSLTTIDQNYDMLCHEAVATMMKMVDGNALSEPQQIRVDPVLVQRESA